MRLTNREVEGVMVVALHGDLRGGHDTERFHNHFKDLLEQEHRKFVLNLQACNWISSPGVGAILGVYAALTSRNASLKIGGYSERVHNLFNTIFLWKVIELYRTETEALEAYRSGSSAAAFNQKELVQHAKAAE